MKQTFKEKLISEALDFYKLNSLLDDEGLIDYPEKDDELSLDGIEQNLDIDIEDIFDDNEEYSALDGIFHGHEDLEFEEDSLFPEPDNGDDEEESLENPEEEKTENPNKQGLIRSIRGAYMIYKKIAENNSYEELWVYNISNVKKQTKIRNSILAGTDVDPVTLRSPDNEQNAEIWTKGNVQFLHIHGLPN